MTKTDQIKALHEQGLAPARIADELGISFQFAYNVLRNAGLIAPREKLTLPARPRKPVLDASRLAIGGFVHSGNWVLSAEGALQLDHPVPKRSGVYAFLIDDAAVYVGVTLRTLEERMNLYRYGHSSQPTNVAMRSRLVDELTRTPKVSIHTMTPDDEIWRGWPISIAAGVEVGIIKQFYLPWNRKGL